MKLIQGASTRAISIRASLIVLALAATLPFVALLAYDTYSQAQVEFEEAREEQSRAANDLAKDIERALGEVSEMLVYMSRKPSVRSFDPNQCDPIFMSFVGLFPKQYTNLLTVRRNGDRVCSAVQPSLGAPAKVNPDLYLSETLRSRAFTVGKVTRSVFTGRWIAIVAYPVMDDSGEMQGVVAAAVDLANLGLASGPVQLAPRAEAQVIDETRMVISSSAMPEKWVGRNLGDSSWSRLLEPDRPESGRALDPEGVERIYGTVPIRGTSWHVAVGIPVDAVHGRVWSRLRVDIAFSLVALLLAIALAYLTARRTTRPVEAIAEAARRAARPPLPLEGLAPADMSSAPKEIRALESDLLTMLQARTEAENKIRRQNRIYSVLSGINTLIVRVQEQDELFREACRIAVDQGGFRIAWIGIVERAARRVRPVAWAGAEQGFLDATHDRYSLSTDNPDARSLVAQAIMAKQPSIANDLRNDSRILFKQEHAERGVESLAVLPLIVTDEVIGALVLHSEERDFFDDDEVKLLVELAGDIAFALDHLEKKKKLNYLAYYDSLTGLANRTLFLERLSQFISLAVNAQHKLAVAILDIERFKTINDTLGRHAGDQLLKQVAERFAAIAKDPATLARIGADQFAIVLPKLKAETDLIRLAESRLRESFAASFRIAETDLRLSARVGVALFPDYGPDADTLLRNAESALKKAKEAGERYVFYSREMGARMAGKLALENQLREALEKEQFVLYYQPKVDLEHRRIVGVEALIRWMSPELGLVPPVRFIPLLEETGLIMEVGSWALHRASLDHRHWIEARLQAPRVAVNVSAIQLRQSNFVAVVEQAVMEGVAPTGIDLEITESLIMDDVHGTIQKLENLQGLGIRVAIDDFGTGYSSLAYLAMLPVHSLKIDRSFIITMLKDANKMTLVRTLIELAHSLNLKVVAEGVDEEEQAKVLRLLRCDEMQGYLFSKPLPRDELAALLPPFMAS